MIVYLARDIPAFVSYCVYGKSGSSLLIETTDSMIRRKVKWPLFFTSRGAHVNCAIMAILYTHSIGNQLYNTMVSCLKCVIVYLAGDIPAFIMYCVYGESGSSLLIESTDSMIIILLLANILLRSQHVLQPLISKSFPQNL